MVADRQWNPGPVISRSSYFIITFHKVNLDLLKVQL